jgi:hypothetical protein
VEAGVIRQKTETDSDNWTENYSYIFSTGAVLGVEVFILEYLSFFAEYSLSYEGSISTSSTSDDGTVTDIDPVYDYSIDTGMGNEAKIGIVIYLDDIIKIDKK